MFHHCNCVYRSTDNGRTFQMVYVQFQSGSLLHSTIYRFPNNRTVGLMLSHICVCVCACACVRVYVCMYRKRWRICFAKLSRFSRVLWCEYMHFFLVISTSGQGNANVFLRKLRWDWNHERLGPWIFSHLWYVCMYTYSCLPGPKNGLVCSFVQYAGCVVIL